MVSFYNAPFRRLLSSLNSVRFAERVTAITHATYQAAQFFQEMVLIYGYTRDGDSTEGQPN